VENQFQVREADFIAEVSSNHNQSLDRCLQFVDTAANIGCKAVKFQLFKVNKLFHPAVFDQRPEIIERKQWELPPSFLPEIAQRCEERDIDFGCSPFSLEAVDELEPFVNFYKIASYEILWENLLKACATTGKPIVMSTGMADDEEIRSAVETIRSAGCENLTLLHCVSNYPISPEECNLSVIEALRSMFDISIGWSDHSVEPGVLYSAIHRWGASTIEFHLSLEDGEGYEAESGHCWKPDDIESVIHNVRTGFLADGDSNKILSDTERGERNWRTSPSDGYRPLRSVRESWEE
jgi:N-acetylneuraminate synthase